MIRVCIQSGRRGLIELWRNFSHKYQAAALSSFYDLMRRDHAKYVRIP